MKLPEIPDFSQEDLKSAWECAKEPEVLDAVFRYNKKYLHWEELKRRELPADPLYIWILMKALRRKDEKYLKFADILLKYNLLDGFSEKLHFLDKSAAGSISSGLESMAQEKDRFIVNSLMEEAIASSQIEGAAVTRRVAKEMLREKRRPKNKDERMVLNNYLTMKEIIRIKNEDLTEELILKIHKIITDNTLKNQADEDYFRDNNDIRIFDGIENVLHTPPDYRKIDNYIEKLCEFANRKDAEFIHPAIKGIILHYLIGYIHPFNDGNGRCARSIFYWFMLKNDYWLFEYMSVSRAIKDSRGKYKLAYQYTESDESDLTYFIKYNLDAIITAVEEVIKYIEEKQKENIEIIRILKEEDLSLRQVEILKSVMKKPEKPVTIKEIMETWNVAYATARSDLLTLEKKGYLSGKKSGREHYFLFRSVKRN
jgi:Fic family protein